MRNANVLIVEDEEKFQSTWRSCFFQARTGPYGDVLFNVRTARSLEKALATIQDFKPIDIVLLDLNIPETEAELDGKEPEIENENGFEVLKRLPSSEFTAVIIVSILKDPNSVAKAFKMGALDVLRKPVLNEQLFHAAMKAWEKAWLRSHLARLAGKFELAIQQSGEEIYDQLAKVVTSKVRTLCELTDNLSLLLRERYLLDSGSNSADPVARKLNEITRESRSLSRQIFEIRNQKVAPPSDFQAFDLVDVRAIVEDIKENLGPPWISHNIEVRAEPSYRPDEIPFRKEIHMILEELILGAIGTYSSSSESSFSAFPKDKIKIVIRNTGNSMEICVEQDAGYVEASGPDHIASNRHIGYSLAKRLASNIGARLEKSTAGGKDTLRLLVPIASGRPVMSNG